MLRLPALLAALTLPAVAAPVAVAESGPGRVVFPLGSTATVDGVDAFGLGAGVAHVDGKTTYAGLERERGLVVAQLLANGALDPAFGEKGISGIGPEKVDSLPLQILRRPDGRFVVVTTTNPESKFETRRIALIGVLADGRRDTAFGVDGVARPGLQASCASCSPAALQPDGSIVVTGHTGTADADISADPKAVTKFSWGVVRLTPGGAPDPSFDGDGTANLAGNGGGGYGVAVLNDGSIGVIGSAAGGGKLARLTASGQPAPGFNGGQPVTITTGEEVWVGIRGHDNGSTDVVRMARDSATQLRRYTAAGTLDPGFSGDGIVDLSGVSGSPSLMAGPADTDLVAGTMSLGEGPGPATIRTHRVNPDGTVALEMAPSANFGGGVATRPIFTSKIPTATSIDQTGFVAGTPFARADGGVVIPGAVNVVRYRGEGLGLQAERAAVLSLTPAFVPDPAFGGPVRKPSIRISVGVQRASTAARKTRYAINIPATASGPGLALLRVTDSKNVVIARSTAPVFKAGKQTLKAYLTKSGRRRLKGARNVRVRVTVRFRDLAYEFAEHKASGRLK